ARRGHTATRLPDGRVLVAGGEGDRGGVGELEAWDPKTGRWSIVATMREPRAFHAAAPLPGGRVMFVGGGLPEHVYWRLGKRVAAVSVETWNATAGGWEPLFYPPHAYVAPKIAPLPDGRLLVTVGDEATKALVDLEVWTAGVSTSAPLWELVAHRIPPPT